MTQRPNIVFIFSDQQRSDTLACYGNDWIKVPHLNSLADESFVFENAYVTQPVCTPARASIMTGLFPHSAGPKVNKMNLPEDVPTIAELISEDYLCGYLGKWHLGDDVIAQHGFDHWISTEGFCQNSALTMKPSRPKYRIHPCI
jgi:arylsulfatase A-like enzyme